MENINKQNHYLCMQHDEVLQGKEHFENLVHDSEFQLKLEKNKTKELQRNLLSTECKLAQTEQLLEEEKTYNVKIKIEYERLLHEHKEIEPFFEINKITEKDEMEKKIDSTFQMESNLEKELYTHFEELQHIAAKPEQLISELKDHDIASTVLRPSLIEAYVQTEGINTHCVIGQLELEEKLEEERSKREQLTSQLEDLLKACAEQERLISELKRNEKELTVLRPSLMNDYVKTRGNYTDFDIKEWQYEMKIRKERSEKRQLSTQFQALQKIFGEQIKKIVFDMQSDLSNTHANYADFAVGMENLIEFPNEYQADIKDKLQFALIQKLVEKLSKQNQYILNLETEKQILRNQSVENALLRQEIMKRNSLWEKEKSGCEIEINKVIFHEKLLSEVRQLHEIVDDVHVFNCVKTHSDELMSFTLGINKEVCDEKKLDMYIQKVELIDLKTQELLQLSDFKFLNLEEDCKNEVAFFKVSLPNVVEDWTKTKQKVDIEQLEICIKKKTNENFKKDNFFVGDFSKNILDLPKGVLQDIRQSQEFQITQGNGFAENVLLFSKKQDFLCPGKSGIKYIQKLNLNYKTKFAKEIAEKHLLQRNNDEVELANLKQKGLLKYYEETKMTLEKQAMIEKENNSREKARVHSLCTEAIKKMFFFKIQLLSIQEGIQIQKLQCSDSKSIDEYNILLEEHLLDANTYEAVESNLKTSVLYTCTDILMLQHSSLQCKKTIMLDLMVEKKSENSLSSLCKETYSWKREDTCGENEIVKSSIGSLEKQIDLDNTKFEIISNFDSEILKMNEMLEMCEVDIKLTLHKNISKLTCSEKGRCILEKQWQENIHDKVRVRLVVEKKFGNQSIMKENLQRQMSKFLEIFVKNEQEFMTLTENNKFLEQQNLKLEEHWQAKIMNLETVRQEIEKKLEIENNNKDELTRQLNQMHDELVDNKQEIVKLTGKAKYLEDQNLLYQAQMIDLETIKQVLEKKLEIGNKSNNELARQLNEIDKDLFANEQEFVQLTEKAQLLEQNLHSEKHWQAKLMNLETSRQEMEKKLEIENNNKDELTRQLNQMHDELADNEREIVKLVDKAKVLEDQNLYYQSQIIDMETTKKELGKKLEIRNNNDELENEFNNVQQRLNEKELKIIEFMEINKILEDQNVSLKEHYEKKVCNLEISNADLKNKFYCELTKKNELALEISIIQKNVTDKEQTILKLIDEVNLKGSAVKNSTSLIAVMEHKIKCLESMKIDMEKKLSMLDMETELLKSKVHECDYTVNNQEKVIMNLRESKSSLEEQLNCQKGFSNLENMIYGLQTALEQSKGMFSEYEKQKSKLESDCENQVKELYEKIKVLMSGNLSLEEELHCKRKHEIDLETEIKYLKNKINDQESKIAFLLDEASVLENQIKHNSLEKAQLQNKLSIIQKTKHDLEIEYNEEINEKLTLQSKYDNLQKYQHEQEIHLRNLLGSDIILKQEQQCEDREGITLIDSIKFLKFQYNDTLKQKEKLEMQILSVESELFQIKLQYNELQINCESLKENLALNKELHLKLENSEKLKMDLEESFLVECQQKNLVQNELQNIQKELFDQKQKCTSLKQEIDINKKKVEHYSILKAELHKNFEVLQVEKSELEMKLQKEIEEKTSLLNKMNYLESHIVLHETTVEELDRAKRDLVNILESIEDKVPLDVHKALQIQFEFQLQVNGELQKEVKFLHQIVEEREEKYIAKTALSNEKLQNVMKEKELVKCLLNNIKKSCETSENQLHSAAKEKEMFSSEITRLQLMNHELGKVIQNLEKSTLEKESQLENFTLHNEKLLISLNKIKQQLFEEMKIKQDLEKKLQYVQKELSEAKQVLEHQDVNRGSVFNERMAEMISNMDKDIIAKDSELHTLNVLLKRLLLYFPTVGAVYQTHSWAFRHIPHQTLIQNLSSVISFLEKNNSSGFQEKDILESKIQSLEETIKCLQGTLQKEGYQYEKQFWVRTGDLAKSNKKIRELENRVRELEEELKAVCEHNCEMGEVCADDNILTSCQKSQIKQECLNCKNLRKELDKLRYETTVKSVNLTDLTLSMERNDCQFKKEVKKLEEAVSLSRKENIQLQDLVSFLQEERKKYQTTKFNQSTQTETAFPSWNSIPAFGSGSKITNDHAADVLTKKLSELEEENNKLKRLIIDLRNQYHQHDNRPESGSC